MKNNLKPGDVVRIIRVRIGAPRLGDLKPREWRHLTRDEIQALKGGQQRNDHPRLARKRTG